MQSTSACENNCQRFSLLLWLDSDFNETGGLNLFAILGLFLEECDCCLECIGFCGFCVLCSWLCYGTENNPLIEPQLETDTETEI